MRTSLLFGTACLVCAAVFAPISGAAEEATDVETSSEHSFAEINCDAPLLVSDLVKDLGHGAEIELIEMTSPIVSDDDEREVGELLSAMIESMMVRSHDSEMEGYLNDLLAQILPHVSRELPFRVVLYDAWEPNAYALAGGRIYVSTGLLSLVENEAQLIGVLAHEMGHHEMRHSVSQLQYMKFFGIWNLEENANMSATALNVLSLPWASRQEQDADAFAVSVLYDLGYSPYQFVRVMLIFDDAMGTAEVDTGESFASFFAPEILNLLEDHPRPLRRACTIRDQIRLRESDGVERTFYLGAQNYGARVSRSKQVF